MVTPKTATTSLSEEPPRMLSRSQGAAAVAFASGVTAMVLIAAFVVWSNQYLPVVYTADETSTRPHFAAGFLATGTLVAVALVLAATTTLVAGLITRAGPGAYQAGVVTQLLAVAAAALVAVAIPVGILHPILAVVPLFCAAVAGGLVMRREKPE